MLQIRTIYHQDPYKFDDAVNASLAEGWILRRRDFDLHGFLAELERVVITEAERCCDNCKYRDADATQPPCVHCGDTADKWEAYDAEN